MQGMWMGCLDLRSTPQDLAQVLTAPTRKAMAEHARDRGWGQATITKAATRFNTFWLLGQWVNVGHTFRAVGTEPGTTVVLRCYHQADCPFRCEDGPEWQRG